jgi:hypothetical protein
MEEAHTVSISHLDGNEVITFTLQPPFAETTLGIGTHPEWLCKRIRGTILASSTNLY